MHLGFLILIMLLIVAPRLVYNEMEIARMKELKRKENEYDYNLIRQALERKSRR